MSTLSHNAAVSVPSIWTRLKLALEDVGGSPMESLHRRIRELEAEVERLSTTAHSSTHAGSRSTR